MIKRLLVLFLIAGICVAQDKKDDLRNVALNRINQYRKMLGLSEIKLNNLLNKAAQAHADYCVANKYMGHNQVKGNPAFSGVTSLDRIMGTGYECKGKTLSEDVAYVANPNLAVDGWIDTLYHRIPIMNANLKEIGYGISEEKNFKADVMEFVAPFSKKESYVIYPKKDQAGIPILFGAEMPNPRPDGSQLSGYPITMTFTFAERGTIVECTEHSLVNSKRKPVDYFLLTPQNDHNKALSDTICIIPKNQLKIDEKYTVTIEAKLSTGTEVNETWSFKTGNYRDVAFSDLSNVSREKSKEAEIIYFLEETQKLIDIEEFFKTGKVNNLGEKAKKLSLTTQWKWEEDGQSITYTNEIDKVTYKFYKLFGKIFIKKQDGLTLEVTSKNVQIKAPYIKPTTTFTIEKLVEKYRAEADKLKEKKTGSK